MLLLLLREEDDDEEYGEELLRKRLFFVRIVDSIPAAKLFRDLVATQSDSSPNKTFARPVLRVTARSAPVVKATKEGCAAIRWHGAP